MSQFFASGGQSIGASASASVLLMNISGLISFRIDWFDLLAVQGTLKSLLQHHSSKASILWCSAFFMVQLSHPYMTTGITKALTRQTFVSQVMSLFFNMLSRFVSFLCGSAGKESACEEGDLGSIPGFGRCPRERKGYPPQYSGLENSMASIVHWVAQSWSRMRDFQLHFTSAVPTSGSQEVYLLLVFTSPLCSKISNNALVEFIWPLTNFY